MKYTRGTMANCNKWIQKNQIFVLFTIFSTIILCVSLSQIRSFDQIVVLNDEFGYWSIGALLSGKDWSSLTSQAPYYSYGYSFILMFLFWLVKTPLYMYKAAILLNFLFLVFSFALAYWCGSKVCNTINKKLLLTICFAITLYSSNVAQVHISWTECFLWFLMWVVISSVISILMNPKSYKIIGFSILLVFLYTVHQRTLGIVISGIILILLLGIFKKVSWKHVISFFLMFTILFVIQSILKDFFMANLFQNNELVANNDYSGQVGKFVLLFSWKGIIYFFQSLCGKIYYLGVSSFFVIYWGLFYVIEKCLLYIKNIIKKRQENNDINLIYIFIACCFFSTLLITVIYTLAPGRVDTLIYGRYNEFCIGILLLMGIYKIFTTINHIWKQLLFFILTFVFAIIVNNALLLLNNNEYAAINSVGVSLFFSNQLSTLNVVFIALLYSVLLILMNFFILDSRLFIKNRIVGCYGFILVLVVSWFVAGEYVINSVIIPMQEEQSETILPLANSMKNYGDNYDLYYIKSDNTRDVNIEYFQYLLPDKSIYSIDYDDINNLVKENNTFLLVQKGYKNTREILESFTIIDQNTRYYLLTKKNNTIEKLSLSQNTEIPIEIFNVDSSNRNEGIVETLVSNGEKGFIINRSYLTLGSGSYELNIDLNINYTDVTDLGYIELVRSKRNEKIKRVPISYLDFNDDKNLNIKIPFSCSSSYNDIELRIKTNDTVHMQINSISYKRTSANYIIGVDSKKEMKQFADLINKIDIKSSINYLAKDISNLSLEYLYKLLPKYEINLLNINNYKLSQEGSSYIILEKPQDIFEYKDLLSVYTIIEKGDKYLLLTNNKIICNATENLGEKLLSNKNILYLNYFSPEQSNIISEKNNIHLKKGTYKITLKVKTLKEPVKGFGKFEIYNDKTLLVKEKLDESNYNNNTIETSLQIQTFNDFGYLHINYYPSEGMVYDVENISIEKISENYLVDLEKAKSTEIIDENRNFSKIQNDIWMESGNYKIKFEFEIKDKVTSDFGEIIAKIEGNTLIQEKIISKSFKTTNTMIVPIQIPIDIISLKSINTKVKLSIKLNNNADIKLKSVEIIPESK